MSEPGLAREFIINTKKASIRPHRIARMLFSLLLSLCFSCAGIPSGGRRLADRPTYLTYPLPCIRGGFTVTCSRGFSPHSVRSCCKKQEHACLPILSFCWFIYQSIVLIYLRILYFSVLCNSFFLKNGDFSVSGRWLVFESGTVCKCVAVPFSAYKKRALRNQILNARFTWYG